jgi:aryl-phospho-beta-D-glucosidase BglC (GH1 family)
MKPVNNFYTIFLMVALLVSTQCKNASTTVTRPSGKLSPQEAIGQMIRGINIGNTMENEMNPPIQAYYFDDYKAAGFTCVRIPVKWGDRISDTPPYTIDPVWMATVEQVIDWGLERDLFIIINGHHENWLKENYNEVNKAKYDSIWSQISVRFRDKSEKLLFEIINEPFGITTEQVNDLNFRIIPIIRRTNPTRIIIYSGKDYCGLSLLMEAAVPNDNYLMGYFHSYDPWDFAGEGNGTWGTSDVNATKARFAQAGQWSSNTNIPVMISEFGARRKCEYNSRMLFYGTYVEEAIRNNVAFQVWDDAGWFGLYNREERTWPDEKDILTKAHPDGPTALAVSSIGSAVTVSWQNRTPANNKIILERRVNDAEFIIIAEIAADASEFTDTTTTSGNSYYYRVISSFSTAPDFYSYPIKIDL